MGESERWLSVEEIGAHLGVSKETMLSLAREEEDSSSSRRSPLEIQGS